MPRDAGMGLEIKIETCTLKKQGMVHGCRQHVEWNGITSEASCEPPRLAQPGWHLVLARM